MSERKEKGEKRGRRGGGESNGGIELGGSTDVVYIYTSSTGSSYLCHSPSLTTL